LLQVYKKLILCFLHLTSTMIKLPVQYMLLLYVILTFLSDLNSLLLCHQLKLQHFLINFYYRNLLITQYFLKSQKHLKYKGKLIVISWFRLQSSELWYKQIAILLLIQLKITNLINLHHIIKQEDYFLKQ
jgi:hypothetical protein